jgi:hypothetical protein
LTTLVENSPVARALELRLGPLVARVPHPNRRAYAFAYGIWALLLLVQTPVVIALPGPTNWSAVAAQGTVLTALGAFLAYRAVTTITDRAFYLYPGGYLTTKPSGRVAVAARWEDVTSVWGLDGAAHVRARVLFGRQRVLYQINHVHGRPRPVKFGEIVGREVVAPLIRTLREEATRRG